MKPDFMLQAYNPRTQEVEAERSISRPAWAAH